MNPLENYLNMQIYLNTPEFLVQ